MTRAPRSASCWSQVTQITSATPKRCRTSEPPCSPQTPQWPPAPPSHWSAARTRSAGCRAPYPGCSPAGPAGSASPPHNLQEHPQFSGRSRSSGASTRHKSRHLRLPLPQRQSLETVLLKDGGEGRSPGRPLFYPDALRQDPALLLVVPDHQRGGFLDVTEALTPLPRLPFRLAAQTPRPP